jgi:alanine racemase-like protein
VGAVSMDLSVADVTDCGDVAPGAEVVVIGSQGAEMIGAAEVAERAGTIPWEILCGIGRRVPRVHLAGGATVSIAAVLPAVKDLAPIPVKDPPKRRIHPGAHVDTHIVDSATSADAAMKIEPVPDPEPREP